MRAYGGVAAAEAAEIARPTAGQGQVLVRVRAADLNGIDWKVREGLVQKVFPLQLPAVLASSASSTCRSSTPTSSPMCRTSPASTRSSE
jgi:NADPH:quinone reductase-like Zn-dependent oxidoreductase